MPLPWRVLRVVVPIAGLLLLNALFVLPAVLLEVPEHPGRLFALGGELVALVTFCVLVARLGDRRWLRGVAMGLALALWLLMWDDYVGKKFLQEATLLYDQLFLAKHLKFLLADVWSWSVAGLIALGIVGSALVMYASTWIMALVTRRGAELSRRAFIATAAAVWSFLLLLSVAPNPVREHAIWGTPPLVHNLRASVDMYRAIKTSFAASPYSEFATSIKLARKPHINLFLVESYGRILVVHREAGEKWKAEVEQMNQELSDAGWHCVTGFSVAPVSGGRSWLAEATLLSGMRVRYEAVFRHMVQEMDRVPHLVSFLRAQGYEAALIAPKERNLRGLRIENTFGYDHGIRHDDLEYRGRRIGWGEIPDQYSLGFAEDNVLSKISAPQFINFHMVSSHAPWGAVPRIVEDWREFNEADVEAPDAEASNEMSNVVDRLRRFRRVEPRFTYMGEMDQLKVDAYWRTIRYDLRVIKRYLHEHEDDRIVLVLGDHQPPFISTIDGSYDVPLHVFARDPALLAEFRAVGFVDGMYISPDEHPVMLHEALFTLMVRALARCCGEPGGTIPEVDFDGVPIGSAG